LKIEMSNMSMEFDDLIDDFVTEALEHLGDVESLLLSLESSTPEAAGEAVQTVFRAVHSVKGAAGFLGLTRINGLAHAAENVLNLMRSSELAPTTQIVDVLLRSIDQLRGMVTNARESNDVDVAELVRILDSLAGVSPEVSQAASVEPAADTHSAAAEEVIAVPAESESVSNVAETSPPKESKPSVQPATPTATAAENSKPPVDANIRVPVATLDRLMNLAGELVLSRNRLVQAVSTRQQHALETISSELDHVTCELQETIMRTRMQPIGNVFSRFTRVVRDLSAKLGKQCDLVIEGRDVEVDKSIAEAIGDPLLHLVRNSLDHGLERPEDRIRKGKGAAGRITLAAFHRGGKICIEIQDDGAGIPVAKIKAKAISQGLITQDQASRMADREALRLIFAPGFSTAVEVTDVSGRGVGMDVVRTNIAKLGGSVDIETRDAKGTTIRLTLPLTLAIIPALIVDSNGRSFAIPQANVCELLRIGADEIAERIHNMKGAQILRIRDTLLPIFHLRQGLEQGDRAALAWDHTASKEPVNVIVVEAGIVRFGLMVDELRDSEEIVVKPLGKHLKTCKMFAGATVLGDGGVALILDISGVAAQFDLARSDAASHAEGLEEFLEKHDADQQTLLVFSNHPDEVFAVPMALVTRLERVRSSQIQRIASQDLLPYGKGTLPILRLENLISCGYPPEEQFVSIIVFNSRGREVGLVAAKLWDIRSVPAEIDDSTFHESGVVGHILLEQQAARILDIQALAHKAYPEWSAAKTPRHTPASERTGPITVMVAEDSGFFRRHLTTILTEAGYQVVESEDGKEAFDQLKHSQTWVDLIVTDIEMPRMTGLELTRSVRQEPELSDIPIVAVTSLAGEDDVSRGREAGVDEYHIKMDREQLLSAVAGLLRSKPRSAKRPESAGANV
jgi:two-component system chemotaxis sensor kinase CheA